MISSLQRLRYLKIVLQGFVILLFLGFNYIINGNSNPFLLFMFGLWNSLFYFNWFLKELRGGDKLNPMIFYIGVSTIYCGISFISTSFEIIYYNQVRLLTVYPQMIIPGALLLTFEQILIVFGFNLGSRIIKSKTINSNVKYNHAKLSIIIYLFVSLSRLFELQRITVLFLYLNDYGGLVSILILLIYKIKNHSFNLSHKIILFLFFIAEFILAFSGDSKEQFMHPFLPIIIYIIYLISINKIKILSLKTLVPISGMLIILLFIIYPVVNIVRYNKSEISITELSVSFKEYTENKNKYYSSDVKNESDALLKRVSLILPYAWSIEYHNSNGTIGPIFYIKGLMSSIPSFIIPNKQPYQPGADITRLIKGYRIGANVTTQTANGIGGTAYISGGITLFIILNLFLGIFIGGLWQLLKIKLFYHPLIILIYIILIRSILRFFENFMDGGITFYLIVTVFLFIAASTKFNFNKNRI